MKKDLNAVSSEYRPNAVTALENNLILHWYPQRVIDRFKRVRSLLELGLGHGFTAKIFVQACDRYVVLEGSSAVIEQFKHATPCFEGEIVETYFEDFSPNQKFDVIIMGFVLEHVDEPDFILRRYRDFLLPGGKLYVAVPNAKSMNRRLGLEMGLIDNIYSLNANDYAQGHQRQFCRHTLRSQLERSGYRVTHEEGIYLKPLPLSVLKKLDNFEANLQAMLRVGVEFPDLCVGILMELEVQ